MKRDFTTNKIYEWVDSGLPEVGPCIWFMGNPLSISEAKDHQLLFVKNKKSFRWFEVRIAKMRPFTGSQGGLFYD